MGGKHQHLGNLDMLGGTGSEINHLGDVVTGQRFDALIHIVGPFIVTVEADVGEMGLHQSGLDIGDAQIGFGDIDAQTVGDGFDSGFRGAIHIAAGVGSVASHTTDVDNNVVAISLFIIVFLF